MTNELTVGNLKEFLNKFPNDTTLDIGMEGVDEPGCQDPLSPGSNILPTIINYDQESKHLQLDFQVTIST